MSVIKDFIMKKYIVMSLIIVSAISPVHAQKKVESEKSVSLSLNDYRRKVLYARYELGQDLASLDKTADIAILRKHIGQLNKQRKSYDTFFNSIVRNCAGIGTLICGGLVGIEILHQYKEIMSWSTDYDDDTKSLSWNEFKKYYLSKNEWHYFYRAVFNKSNEFGNFPDQHAIDASRKSVGYFVGRGIVPLLCILWLNKAAKKAADAQEMVERIDRLMKRDKAIIAQLQRK